MEILNTNRRNTFNYDIKKSFDCGIVLLGTEIGMIKQRKFNTNESYCYINNGELWVKNFYVNENHRGFIKHDPKREKKLLVKKKELKEIIEFVQMTSNTLIPLNVFKDSNSRLKMKIGLGVGKKNYDKRNTIKEREMKREIERGKNKE